MKKPAAADPPKPPPGQSARKAKRADHTATDLGPSLKTAVAPRTANGLGTPDDLKAVEALARARAAVPSLVGTPRTCSPGSMARAAVARP